MLYVYSYSEDEANAVVEENKRLDNGAYVAGQNIDGQYEVRVIPGGNNPVYLGKNADGMAIYENVKVW